MITAAQKRWLSHLRNDDAVKIYPPDPLASAKFEKIKKKIRLILGKDAKIELCGATSLGISGQGELDINIPVPPDKFYFALKKLKAVFGIPGSVYKLKRARFVTYAKKTKSEIILVNQRSSDWSNCQKFENYLKTHPAALMAYERLKEAAAGLNTREYYRKKIEFINEILVKQ
jgi:GrpB-like predicted nucleotidyltransferase (UPF0157 family)